MIKKLFSSFSAKKHEQESVRQKSFSACFKTKTIEFNEIEYQIRELSVAERVAFQQFASDDESNPLIVCSWLISKACVEFASVPPEDIAAGCGPAAINFIADKILELCGLTEEAIEEEEKK